MKKAPYLVDSISELHRLLELPKPQHPLVSVIHMEDIKCHFDESLTAVMYNFYSICIKKDFKGKLKYGQNYYDFDEGIMTFFSPGQVISTEMPADNKINGIWLVIHPDFLRTYSMGTKIREYGFFSYAVNEALHLSDKEESMINAIMGSIANEYYSQIDSFSQDVIVSQIELLLNYCNRFYNRQFITRKSVNSDLLIRLEALLDDYFDAKTNPEDGLPTVKFIAEKMNVSPHYLSDMLRSHTGQNAQQHIHNKLIGKAKEILTTTPLTVSEIAFRLGFEYPQSFSKLFKAKTNVSPLEYRRQFN